MSLFCCCILPTIIAFFKFNYTWQGTDSSFHYFFEFLNFNAYIERVGCVI